MYLFLASAGRTGGPLVFTRLTLSHLAVILVSLYPTLTLDSFQTLVAEYPTDS